MPQTRLPQPPPLRFQFAGAASLFLMLVGFAGFDWRWSLLLMGAVASHEFGHLFVARLYGVPTAGMLFMPFGAVALMGERPARAECPVALAGSLAGAATAIPFWLGYLATNDARLAGFAGVICGFNLLNLMPLKPFDGGRVVGTAIESISPMFALVYLTATSILILPVSAVLGMELIGLILVVMNIPLLYNDTKRILGRQAIVFNLARHFGVPATAQAVLDARMTRLQEIVMTDAKGSDLPLGCVDKFWDNLEEFTVRNHSIDLETYLRNEPVRLSVGMAAVWLCTHAMLAVGLWFACTATEDIMPWRETMAVMLHR